MHSYGQVHRKCLPGTPCINRDWQNEVKCWCRLMPAQVELNLMFTMKTWPAAGKRKAWDCKTSLNIMQPGHVQYLFKRMAHHQNLAHPTHISFSSSVIFQPGWHPLLICPFISVASAASSVSWPRRAPFSRRAQSFPRFALIAHQLHKCLWSSCVHPVLPNNWHPPWH